MPKFTVCLTRNEWLEIEADDEDEAYDVAIETCEGFGDLTHVMIEEIDDDEAEEAEAA